jgi:protein TonB
VIGKDGGTSDIQVLSGPPMLTQAATNAVKQWVYVPYTQNGQILEMETTVNVIFNLAN